MRENPESLPSLNFRGLNPCTDHAQTPIAQIQRKPATLLGLAPNPIAVISLSSSPRSSGLNKTIHHQGESSSPSTISTSVTVIRRVGSIF